MEFHAVGGLRPRASIQPSAPVVLRGIVRSVMSKPWLWRSAFAVALLSLATACGGGAGSTAPAPDVGVVAGPLSEEGNARPELPPSLHWARNSAEAKAAYVQAFRTATERLEEMVADREPGTWAISIDADETTIDNSQYEVELVAVGDVFSDETWHAWAARQEAVPVPGVAAFLSRVHELGGKIAIVTNRKEVICEDTEANLRKIEIPFDLLLCRPTGADREKEPRWDAIEAGTAAPDVAALEIVMWLGDNIGDFPGLDQELAREGEEAYAEFGSRFIVLPNPVYGSWESNPPD